MPPLTDFLTGNTSLICLQHIFNSMIVFLVYIVFLNGMLFVTMCSTWLILSDYRYAHLVPKYVQNLHSPDLLNKFFAS